MVVFRSCDEQNLTPDRRPSGSLNRLETTIPIMNDHIRVLIGLYAFQMRNEAKAMNMQKTIPGTW
jgi:hypothetical protein